MSDTQIEAQRPTRLSANDFRDVIGCFASGVAIITTDGPDGQRGATASAITSLSLDPPMVVVCLNKESATAKSISLARRFVINILSENQLHLAMRFAGHSADKFKDVPIQTTPWGGPILEEVLAVMDCRVSEEISGGTHWVILAEVENATRRIGAPLAYFRGKMGPLAMEPHEAVYQGLSRSS